MDLDDLPKADDPLSQLEREELDSLSLEELDERVSRLEAEIVRAGTMRKNKEASRAAAESIFKT